MITRESNKLVRIPVHPSFRKWIRLEAIKNGKSMIKFTKDFGEKMEREEKPRNGFNIGF